MPFCRFCHGLAQIILSMGITSIAPDYVCFGVFYLKVPSSFLNSPFKYTLGLAVLAAGGKRGMLLLHEK